MSQRFTMESGSVVSEPISAHHRAFAKQKSASMVSVNIYQVILELFSMYFELCSNFQKTHKN